MQKYTVVYSDPSWAVGPDGCVDPALATIERSVLGEDVELRFGPTENGRYCTSGFKLHAVVANADALVISRCPMTEDLLAAAGAKVKVVCRQGVGFDNLNPDLLRSRGIIGFNIPDYCVDEVSAHAIALLLALERGLFEQHRTVLGGGFSIYAGGTPRRLKVCTAGIIGFGRIGRTVAERLRAFYKRVISCDPYISGDDMTAHGVEKVDFTELLSQADAVLLHCHLNNETFGMIDQTALAHFKPTTWLVNVSRGALVNSKALWEALEQGRIAGAGIDVFCPENPHQDEWYKRIVRHPNVLATSHRAYLSHESESIQRRRAAEGIRHVLVTGRPPLIGTLA
jgi:phosphoglycerate dehydrogenase-like enzyme